MCAAGSPRRAGWNDHGILADRPSAGCCHQPSVQMTSSRPSRLMSPAPRPWENRRVPEGNDSKDKTAASMQRMAEVMAKEKAQLWINHDKAQRDGLKMSPGFYD